MITFLLLIVALINLTTSQIPNPGRYQVTIGNGPHYAVDKIRWRLSSKIYSTDEDPSSVSNHQNIYVPSEGRTYAFDLKSSPPCIVNRGAFLKDIDYWGGLVESWGGENTTYDEIIFDQDCGGPCLTWFKQHNETAYTHSNYRSRLYIRQSDATPIKITSARYDLKTGELLSTGVNKFTYWNLDEIPDSEFQFPIDTKKCYFA